MNSIRELEASALRLSKQQRGRLANKLLASLPPPPGAWSQQAILEEARNRDHELSSGQMKPMTEEQFWSGVRRNHG